MTDSRFLVEARQVVFEVEEQRVVFGIPFQAALTTGTGDATGPGSSTDNAITRFDGITGKLLQNSAATLDDSGNIATAGTVDGRDLSVDGAKLDGIEAGATADQTITAGAGLIGGGSGDVTLNVVANADASIVVNADDMQVGVLAADGQHGVRGGGTQHAAATTSVNGFLTADDKIVLDGIAEFAFMMGGS